MRVALISTYFDIEAGGLRMLSSVLRRAGHDTCVVFLPKRADQGTIEYPPEAIQDIVEICRGADLIGLTLMTNNYLTARHLTEQLREHLEAPIAWGGIHATVRPEECLESADWVCQGEGEEAMVDLANALEAGEDTDHIPNLWVKRDGEIIRNAVRPVVEDLDTLPYADYSLKEHYLLEHGRVVKMTHEQQERALLYKYMTSTSRGCILNCSFCCHNAFRKMYGATAGNTRRRSVDHVMGELEQMRESMPYIRYVTIDDDSFMDAKLEYIEEFARQYKERCGLPFMVTGFIPITVTREKTAALVDAGMYNVRMGIQSGAQNTKRIYRRNIKDSVILRAAGIFDEFRKSIKVPNYDLILDNPWETDEDRADTMRLMQALPRPFLITFYSLTFYPGTDLFDRAIKDGYITDEKDEVYRKDYLGLRRTYMNGLAYLFGAYQVPKPIERFLLHPKTMKMAPDFMYYPLWFMGWPMYLATRALKFIIEGDITRPLRWARLGVHKLRFALNQT